MGIELYNYINVLDRGADASWLRNEALTNNIANQDTPGYIRSDVQFEDILKRELRRGRNVSLDQRVANTSMKSLTSRIYTDYTGTSYRIDGNNVDPENEEVELASNEIRYQAILDSINSEFSQIKTVLK